MKFLLSASLSALMLAACSPASRDGEGVTDESAAPSMTAAEASSLMASEEESEASGMAAASAFVGQWKGPEGTNMTITPAGDRFDIAIRDLDGTRDFSGVRSGNGLKFERDGKTLTIRAGNGDDTGMKWLAGKQDCLVVDAHEGYCRD